MPDAQPPTRTVKAADLAEEYGLTPRAVKKWTKDGCPFTDLGRGRGRGYRFDRDEVRQWLKETERRLTHGGGPGGAAQGDLKEQIHRANLRKAIAMAMRYELDVEQKRGALVSRDEVERGRVERVSYTRARLMGGPSAIAPDLVGLTLEEIEATLTQWVIAALSDLAGGDSK